jgi:hypothetical protein
LHRASFTIDFSSARSLNAAVYSLALLLSGFGGLIAFGQMSTGELSGNARNTFAAQTRLQGVTTDFLDLGYPQVSFGGPAANAVLPFLPIPDVTSHGGWLQ